MSNSSSRFTKSTLGGLAMATNAPLPEGVTIRPATLDDCGDLAHRLRIEDQAEAFASSGVPAEYALRFSVLFWPASVVCVDGVPELICGCPKGSPWMLCTPVAVSPRWRKTFVRHSREHINSWQAEFGRLHGFTDARNPVHHTWLRRTGFTFIGLNVPYGPHGLPFHEFERTASHV